MNCWEILGIDPTGDHRKIRQAYEQQCKFASADEAQALARAYREATGQNPEPVSGGQDQGQLSPAQTCAEPEPEPMASASQELSGHDAQVVREVVIQISALLNDQSRSADVNIWKAIVCEPPADRPAIRREVGQQLEARIRPMADNGALPAPVAGFLGDWFGWPGLGERAQSPERRMFPEPPVEGDVRQQPAGGGSIWVAMIGWIIALAVLATLFSNMGFQ